MQINQRKLNPDTLKQSRSCCLLWATAHCKQSQSAVYLANIFSSFLSWRWICISRSAQRWFICCCWTCWRVCQGVLCAFQCPQRVFVSAALAVGCVKCLVLSIKEPPAALQVKFNLEAGIVVEKQRTTGINPIGVVRMPGSTLMQRSFFPLQKRPEANVTVLVSQTLFELRKPSQGF